MLADVSIPLPWAPPVIHEKSLRFIRLLILAVRVKCIKRMVHIVYTSTYHHERAAQGAEGRALYPVCLHPCRVRQEHGAPRGRQPAGEGGGGRDVEARPHGEEPQVDEGLHQV